MASRDKAYRDNEPSVEEILGSIKRIIAEKDGVAASRRAARRPARPARREEEDILDLDDAFIAADESGAAYDSEGDSTILSDIAAQSVRHSFEALATMSEPGAQPQIVRSGETSIESLVREMLKPMLKDWLDANLPAMVEEAVAEEIRRIGGRGRR